MNMQTLLAQLGKSSNPMTMLTKMLTPNQRQIASQLQGKTNEEQAEEIAKKCNEMGITKEQLQSIVSMLNKR